MTNIFLNNNKGFSWYSNETISVKGCFFDAQNKFYEKENLLSFFKNITTQTQFITKIKEANGFFTVLIKVSETIFMASDTTRKFPLFYSYKKNNLFISDAIIFLKDKLRITKTDEQSVIEFKASGYTLGNKTLLKDIYQLQSNEYLIFENQTLKNQGFFFNYATRETNKSVYSKLKGQAIQAFENAFERLIISLNNRPVAVPLSGGYDSRLIAVMLKKHNYKNVICYTYGKKGSYEIENSRKTAKALNYKWVFIEYTQDLMRNYIDSESFKDYAHFSSKYISLPSLQEYFAVKYLTDNKLIPSDTIFIPGYSGDFIGGSRYIKILSENLQTQEIIDLILKKKFYHNKPSTKEKKILKESINGLLSSFDANYKEKIPSTVYENFYLKEASAKFIFKTSCLYTFFGYEHRFPFWDMELLCFFKEVPSEYKKMKMLYDAVLKNHYFKIFNVNFEKEIQPNLRKIHIQKIKNNIKPLFPHSIIKKMMAKNEWANFEEITRQMEASMKKNNLPYHSKIKVYNEINIQWYLYFAMDLIKQKIKE